MLPIALNLIASAVPSLIGMFAGKGAQSVAEKVVAIAQEVTGESTPDAAQKAIEADPALSLQFKKAVLDQRVELERIALEVDKVAAGVVSDVNKTMQAEAAAEHWPTYSWRPFIGFMFGAYVGSMWLLPLFGKAPAPLSADLTLAIGAILGVASWFRGQMQADPRIPTINRG